MLGCGTCGRQRTEESTDSTQPSMLRPELIGGGEARISWQLRVLLVLRDRVLDVRDVLEMEFFSLPCAVGA